MTEVRREATITSNRMYEYKYERVGDCECVTRSAGHVHINIANFRVNKFCGHVKGKVTVHNDASNEFVGDDPRMK